jgi:hypothetical protein
MFDDEQNESWEVDAEGLTLGRWPSLMKSLKAALTRGPVRFNLELCVVIEHELGLRPIVTSADQMPRRPEEIIELLMQYEDEHPHLICRFAPALERALACYPYRWLSYIDTVGRSNFDPVELGACAGICRRYATEPTEHTRITAIIFWVLECLIGQYPAPEIRELPQRGDPTLRAQIIQKIEAIQLNWKKLGLRPVVTSDMVVRWEDGRCWVVWVRLANTKTGVITPRCVLRLRSDGLFRLIRT